MTSPTGSISVSGLLGGIGGQIDVPSLISKLMQAQAVPQNQLKDQLTATQAQLSVYQAVNSRATALQAAAHALTDPTAWTATAATSSNPAVIATSSGAASPGSTTFDVLALAAAQVSTVAADSNGNVVADPSAGITITGADGNPHPVQLTSGSASSVASAINAANVGVRASTLHTDQGDVLQLSSAKTGTANRFTAGGFSAAVQTLATAADAKVGVGSGSGAYTLTSSSNTFSGQIPGVTFSVAALATGVTVSVAQDTSGISAKVQALVNAANAAQSEMSADTSLGAVLQGKSDVRSLLTSLMSSVSQGDGAGGSLKTYGIDLQTTGQFTFDPAAFATAYAADPDGTRSAVSGAFATRMQDVTTAAVDAQNGTITQAITGLTTRGSHLDDEIATWTTRLGDIQANLQNKYNAMETALARLQSQQTYLTSMFKSMGGSSSSGSS